MSLLKKRLIYTAWNFKNELEQVEFNINLDL